MMCYRLNMNITGVHTFGYLQEIMSGICQDRRSRWQEIQKGLQFIQ